MGTERNGINRFIEQIAGIRTITITLIAFVTVLLLVNVLFKQEFQYLTQTVGYTPAYAYETLESIGAGGRHTHLLVLIPDLIMVVLYTLFLMGANYGVYSRGTRSSRFLSVVTLAPLLLAATQIAEIVLLAFIILHYPTQFLLLAGLANYITMVKTALTVLLFLCPLLGLGALGIKRLTKAGAGNGGKKPD